LSRWLLYSAFLGRCSCGRTSPLLPDITLLSIRAYDCTSDRMVVFFIGLMLLCFTISTTPTRAFVTATTIVLVSLVVWCIRTAWESTEDEDLWRNSLVVLRRTRDDLFRSVKQFGLDTFRSFPPHRVPPAESIRSAHFMVERQSAFGV